jgi:hypothetical protein
MVVLKLRMWCIQVIRPESEEIQNRFKSSLAGSSFALKGRTIEQGA